MQLRKRDTFFNKMDHWLFILYIKAHACKPIFVLVLPLSLVRSKFMNDLLSSVRLSLKVGMWYHVNDSW